MRLKKFVIMCAIVFVPALIQGEVLLLKDGSEIQGRLVKFVNDTLFFETSFGALIEVPREKVARLSFDGAPAIPQASVGAVVTPTSTSPGTVSVNFDNVKLSSKITVHRNKNQAELLRANWIECVVYVGSKLVYTEIDSIMDKTVREGPDTRYLNDMRPSSIKVAVDPGTTQLRLFVRNPTEGATQFAKSFPDGPLSKTLLVDPVTINSNHTRELVIAVKRKAKMGSPQLVLFE